MKLTLKQQEDLWSDSGPYSEACIVIQTPVVDAHLASQYIQVIAYINPLTFEIISKNRKFFLHDQLMLDLIDKAKQRSADGGYVWCPYVHEYVDEEVMKHAQMHLSEIEGTLLKMHQFTIDLLGL